MLFTAQHGVPRRFPQVQMPETLLLADIGNTNIKIGFALPEWAGTLKASYSLPSSRAPHTGDSLGLALLDLLRHQGLEPRQLSACLACSVVPEIDPLFRHACERFLGITPLRFPLDFSLSLENHYSKPHEVGADRLLAAFAARRLFPEPKSLISVDFGTATTFDCVSGQAYLGGLIAPGLLSSHAALSSQTAKLPRISLEMKDDAPLIGRDTPTSINHGFLFGFAAMAEGLCARLKEHLPGPVEVVGTGGFAADVARICSAFDHLRPELILDGLRLAWGEHQH